ncbi:hypothetical protein AB1Y20_007245 [Prymnesium parvum]|uniref:Ion transport domain-containing protein n=1 Tax=Prymnesium parvum TaxID=97485 RepID=A0AB34IU93_PRYPA
MMRLFQLCKSSPDSLDDTNVEAVIARNLWKNHRLLPPLSRFKQNWDMVMIILVFYNCAYIPVEIAFLTPLTIQKHVVHTVVDYLIDFIFGVDIVINLRTAFYDEEHELVLDPKQIRMRYMKFWFWLDFLAFFPFEQLLNLVSLMTQTQGGDGFGALTGLFKLPRLCRMARFLKKLDVVAAANAFRIVALMVGFCLVAHWFACIWWFVGLQEFRQDRAEISERDQKLAECNNSSLTSFELQANCSEAAWSAYYALDHGTSWLTRVPGHALTEDSPLSHQYMSSMYWALTTLMKTPWVGPDTELEKTFASFAVVMGAILFAALLGNVTALVQSFDKGSAQKRDKISVLHQFNTSRKVPSALQRKLFAYVDAEWDITEGIHDSSVLLQLPSQVRGSIAATIYGDTLLKTRLFSSCSLECAKALLLRLQPEVCLQKEVLIAREQLCQELYFLLRGAMQIAASESPPSRAQGTPTGQMLFQLVEQPGAIIGHIEPFEREVLRYPFLVTAVRQSHLVRLHRGDVQDVLANFEGEDSDAVLQVLKYEHQNTVFCLTEGTASRQQKANDPVDRQGVVTPLEPPSERELQELRAKVNAMELKLAKCVDDMRAARECTEVLPQLVYLVNEASRAAT